ncbi:MAG TPA: GtrA family protein [Ktedonobacterales bacterium]|jgi:putative flippase GtrA
MLTSLERVGGLEEEASQAEMLLTRQPRSEVLSTTFVRWLDRWTWGHGEQALRLASFLIVGGLGTIVNLGCVWVFSRFTPLPYALYVVLATEISLICNFALNDRFTFRALVDGRRNWWVRCLRFHAPAMLGFALTLLLSDVAHYVLHLPPLVAQGAAILIVTFVNFAVHHLWTYRAVQEPEQPRSADAAA